MKVDNSVGKSGVSSAPKEKEIETFSNKSSQNKRMSKQTSKAQAKIELMEDKVLLDLASIGEPSDVNSNSADHVKI